MKTLKRFMSNADPIVSFKIKHNKELFNFERECMSIMNDIKGLR